MENDDALMAFPELTPPEAPIAVARVLVDADLPNLDRPLDYEIPAELDGDARPGHQVKVRLAGRQVRGWIVERTRGTDQLKRLQPLLAVVSKGVEAPPQTLALARYLADRHASTASQVLSLAIPARHARAEKAVLGSARDALRPTDATEAVGAADPAAAWAGQPVGEALVSHLRSGGAPRAVWLMLPGGWVDQLAACIRTTREAGRGALVVVPTVAEAEALGTALGDRIDEDVVVLTGETASEERYALHLEVQRGEHPVVVGTRSAQWLPMRDVGLFAVLDEGSDSLRELRSPRVSSLDVLVARSHLEDVALLVGSFSRSAKAQYLVQSGWAASIDPPREMVRSLTTRVAVPDELDAEREGPTGHARLPRAATQLIRSALEAGPVLVQVPLGGYVPVVSCDRCRQIARCVHCGGPETLGADAVIRCGWCGRGTSDWRCPHCSGTKLRSVRVGSERTSEELGRLFPGVALTQSSAARGILAAVDSKPRLVVATPGAEPRARGGYTSVVIMDGDATAGRPELWAQEEALRRWFNALSLARPGTRSLVLGLSDQVVAQTLVRWDPVDFALRTLDERTALGFFPVTTIVALDGEDDQVADVVDQLDADVMGTVPRGGEDEVRALVRAPREGASDLLGRLRAVQQARAAKKQPLVRATVNPPELF